MVARSKEGDTDRPARLGKMPGSDETIAAIVSRAAKYRHGPLGPVLFNHVRDCFARILHQLSGRCTGSHCQSIGFTHPANIE
jgi:hypothetical protein